MKVTLEVEVDPRATARHLAHATSTEQAKFFDDLARELNIACKGEVGAYGQLEYAKKEMGEDARRLFRDVFEWDGGV